MTEQRFTDEDWKRLKDRLISDRATALENNFPTDEIDLLDALLARLEDSEQERDYFKAQLEKVRAMPSRSNNCPCFDIANKALGRQVSGK